MAKQQVGCQSEVLAIEVSAAMIEAGRGVYASYFADLRHDETGEVSRRMISEIYVAMERSRKLRA